MDRYYVVLINHTPKIVKSILLDHNGMKTTNIRFAIHHKVMTLDEQNCYVSCVQYNDTIRIGINKFIKFMEEL